jgi:hypothetical protein
MKVPQRLSQPYKQRDRVRIEDDKRRSFFEYVDQTDVYTIEGCLECTNFLSQRVHRSKKPWFFVDLHDTFDAVIWYAQLGENERKEVYNVLKDYNVVIVTYIGASTRLRESAINDIQWAIPKLGILFGVIVKGRGYGNPVIFEGGKGWIINLICQQFDISVIGFADDAQDHRDSVESMCKVSSISILATHKGSSDKEKINKCNRILNWITASA